MKKNGLDKDLPVGKLTRIPNFLPPPDQLVFPEETVKVTLAINKSSLDFFKKQARKNGGKYQRMIRELLDRYASQYSS